MTILSRIFRLSIDKVRISTGYGRLICLADWRNPDGFVEPLSSVLDSPCLSYHAYFNFSWVLRILFYFIYETRLQILCGQSGLLENLPKCSFGNIFIVNSNSYSTTRVYVDKDMVTAGNVVEYEAILQQNADDLFACARRQPGHTGQTATVAVAMMFPLSSKGIFSPCLRMLAR